SLLPLHYWPPGHQSREIRLSAPFSSGLELVLVRVDADRPSLSGCPHAHLGQRAGSAGDGVEHRLRAVARSEAEACHLFSRADDHARLQVDLELPLVEVA